MADHARTRGGPGPIRRRPKNSSGDVFAGTPARPRSFQQERFATVYRERLNLDDDFVVGRLGFRNLSEGDHVVFVAGWNECSHE